MSLLLLLDTTGTKTSVAISRDENCLVLLEEEFPNSHAQKITLLIQEALHSQSLLLSDLEGVVINSGPGSYTGLRIGAATAKGLCYGLNIPLMAINGLEALSIGIRETLKNKGSYPDQYCPLLDARRMEVFMAVFNQDMKPERNSQAEIISNEIFEPILKSRTLFFGSGAKKLKESLPPHPNALFDLDFKNSARDLCKPGQNAFAKKKFENLIDFEPFYLKEFYSPIPLV